ncbi:hypothetical protein [Acidisoma sp. C75]
MKSKTLDRLDLIRASQEMRLLEQLAHQNNQLQQLAHQREVLAAYQEKLAEGWRAGSTSDAATLRRAASFSAASRQAGEQISQMQADIAERVLGMQENLAQSKAYERKLAEARDAALRLEERRQQARRERQEAPSRRRENA